MVWWPQRVRIRVQSLLRPTTRLCLPWVARKGQMLDVLYTGAEFAMENLACLTRDPATLEELIEEHVEVGSSGLEANDVAELATDAGYCEGRLVDTADVEPGLLEDMATALVDAGLDPEQPIGEQDASAVSALVDGFADVALGALKKIRVDEKHIILVDTETGGTVTICAVD